jgi:superfamily II DNA or RNA helicase
LIQRARILKQASKKPELALKIIENNFSEGEHWLVYCDDTNQLNSVINTLSSQGIRTFKYTSAMLGDRPQTLEMFKYKAGVLVAIKCLDEGVDLPYLSHAVILASSKNPREHIQRRGRVLRKSDEKYSSSIYDAIVLPNKNTANLENDSIMMGELQRAISFAEGASNPSSKIELIQLAQRFNIKIDKLTSNNLEEE